MKDSIIRLINNFADLVDLKSVITLAVVAFMGILLSGVWNPPQGMTEFFCASAGSIFTYYFTHK